MNRNISVLHSAEKNWKFEKSSIFFLHLAPGKGGQCQVLHCHLNKLSFEQAVIEMKPRQQWPSPSFPRTNSPHRNTKVKVSQFVWKFALRTVLFGASDEVKVNSTLPTPVTTFIEISPATLWTSLLNGKSNVSRMESVSVSHCDLLAVFHHQE